MFISRKTELEGELEDTKTELLRERKKHEQIISELERKTVQVESNDILSIIVVLLRASRMLILLETGERKVEERDGGQDPGSERNLYENDRQPG